MNFLKLIFAFLLSIIISYCNPFTKENVFIYNMSEISFVIPFFLILRYLTYWSICIISVILRCNKINKILSQSKKKTEERFKNDNKRGTLNILWNGVIAQMFTFGMIWRWFRVFKTTMCNFWIVFFFHFILNFGMISGDDHTRNQLGFEEHVPKNPQQFGHGVKVPSNTFITEPLFLLNTVKIYSQ